MRIFKDHRGRQVRVTDERWEHILEHREMIGLDEAVEVAVGDPELVIVSKSDPTCLLNYRFISAPRFGDMWLCAVVKYLENDAFLVTAYLTDKIKAGQQVWPTK